MGMREEFEAWATANGISIVRTNQALMFANGQRRAVGDYIMVESVCAWAAWEESRATLVVELPRDVDQFADDDPGRRAFSLHTNTAYRECRKIIEAAGVTVK